MFFFFFFFFSEKKERIFFFFGINIQHVLFLFFFSSSFLFYSLKSLHFSFEDKNEIYTPSLFASIYKLFGNYSGWQNWMNTRQFCKITIKICISRKPNILPLNNTHTKKKKKIIIIIIIIRTSGTIERARWGYWERLMLTAKEYHRYGRVHHIFLLFLWNTAQNLGNSFKQSLHLKFLSAFFFAHFLLLFLSGYKKKVSFVTFCEYSPSPKH